MNKLVFENVNKKYGKVVALKDFSLSIKEHELIVILGTSGSGKTTLLRIISGLENSYDGDIFLDDKPLNEIEIRDRKTALVFQSYALYPQMTALQNLTLPLKQEMFYKPVLDKNGNQVLKVDYDKIDDLKDEIKIRKEDKKALKEQIKEIKKNPSVPFFAYQRLTEEEINQRLNKIKGMLDISSFLEQRVSTLSGGQKQRIAIGKALLKEPDILLMDEPLSNLDAKLRAGSRELIRRIHEKAKATTIVVSHDQNDAYALADRVVILDEGKIQQVGSVDELYAHPNNMTVARFLGNPSMNFLTANYNGDKIQFVDSDISFDVSNETKDKLNEYINKEIVVGIRPEEIAISNSENTIKVIYDRNELFGKEFLHHINIGENEIIIRSKDKIKPQTKEIGIELNENKILFFDKENEQLIN